MGNRCRRAARGHIRLASKTPRSDALDPADILGLRALLPGADIELDALVVIEALVALAGEVGVPDEGVLAAVI